MLEVGTRIKPNQQSRTLCSTELCKTEVTTRAEFLPKLTGLVAELTFVRPTASMGIWIRVNPAFVAAGPAGPAGLQFVICYLLNVEPPRYRNFLLQASPKMLDEIWQGQ